MAHYYCAGSCNGVSEEPGTCQAKECEKHGQPLTVCVKDDCGHND